jgi:hypothetical protein
MIDLFNLLGLLLCFAGTLLLALFRIPSLELTADGRSLAQGAAEPPPAERAGNLRRYWRHAAATRVGLIFLCVGFALQLLAFLASFSAADQSSTTRAGQDRASAVQRSVR